MATFPLPRFIAVAAVVAFAGAWAAMPEAATKHKIPLSCTKGPKEQYFSPTVTVPGNAAPGAVYTLRIDGPSSGIISQTGLNHIHGMSYDYLVPNGAEYVEGSAKIVPGTGTSNVRAGARVSHDRGTVRVVLPGHVDDGSSYTPPSVELEVRAAATAGTAMVFKFTKYRVTANAIIVGDVDVSCDPDPKPYPLGTTVVTPPG